MDASGTKAEPEVRAEVFDLVVGPEHVILLELDENGFINILDDDYTPCMGPFRASEYIEALFFANKFFRISMKEGSKYAR